METPDFETEHAVRWASAVRRHIEAYAPHGGEVELLDQGARCRVVLWRNEARTRAFAREISAGDIVDWGEHFVGELFGLLHKSIFGQGWHVALPKEALAAKPKHEEVIPEAEIAVVMAPVSIQDAHPTGPLPQAVDASTIAVIFSQFTRLSSWPKEARLELIDGGMTVAFLVEGDEHHRYRQLVGAQTFLEQQLATITRFLTRYQARLASDTDLGLG